MSIRRNIVANYAGQGYTALVGLVVVPLYLKHMGPEAYGLVGFFSVMQTWFQLLDLGLNPTLGRQMARYRGKAMSALELRRLLRAMEIIFYGVAIIGAVTLVAFSPLIARRWLH